MCLSVLLFASLKPSKQLIVYTSRFVPLRRGHANLLCTVPILMDDPRRESNVCLFGFIAEVASVSIAAPPYLAR